MQLGVVEDGHREPVYKRGLKSNVPKRRPGYLGGYPNVQMILLLAMAKYKATSDLHVFSTRRKFHYPSGKQDSVQT